MKKSKIRKYYTDHGAKRLAERIDIQGAKFDVIAKSAFKNGKVSGQLPDGELKKYLFSRERNDNKKVKIYKGYIFVFFKSSHRVITCYPLPNRLKAEYEKTILNKK